MFLHRAMAMSFDFHHRAPFDPSANASSVACKGLAAGQQAPRAHGSREGIRRSPPAAEVAPSRLPSRGSPRERTAGQGQRSSEEQWARAFAALLLPPMRRKKVARVATSVAMCGGKAPFQRVPIPPTEDAPTASLSVPTASRSPLVSLSVTRPQIADG